MNELEALKKRINELIGQIYIVVGLQWGDEGKGKIIDYLAEIFHLIIRYNGANNAGHSVFIDDVLCHLHFIASGILWPDKIAVCAAGELLELKAFFNEIKYLKYFHNIEPRGRLIIDPRVNVIMPTHRALDIAYEIIRLRDTGGNIGTTAKGVGPGYADFSARAGVRIHELLSPNWEDVVTQKIRSHERLIRKGLGITAKEMKTIFEQLTQKDHIYNRELLEEGQLEERLCDYTRYVYANGKINLNQILSDFRGLVAKLAEYDCVHDASLLINQAIDDKKNILFEGGQGTGLDVGFGTWRNVTSSHVISGGACIGAGIGPTKINRIIGVAKAFTTRVGNGPMPTEDELFGRRMRGKKGTPGAEFGTTTGRPRRLGPFDAVLVAYYAMLNGITDLSLTKLDFLDKEKQLRICHSYSLGGEILTTLPADPNILEDPALKPNYIVMEGWRTSTRNIRSFDTLPQNAKRYVRLIQTLIQNHPGNKNVRLHSIGVGPNRKEIIICDY